MYCSQRPPACFGHAENQQCAEKSSCSRPAPIRRRRPTPTESFHPLRGIHNPDPVPAKQNGKSTIDPQSAYARTHTEHPPSD